MTRVITSAKLYASAIVALVFASGFAAADSAYPAQVTGRVVSSTGAPIPGADVFLCDAANQLCGADRALAVSSGDGSFVASAGAGEYRVYAQAEGFIGRFYGDEPWVGFPLNPSTASTIAVDDTDVDLPPISLTAGDGSERFCAEPRRDEPGLAGIEARRPGESVFSEVAIEGSSSPRIGCRIKDQSDRQKVELFLPDGRIDLSSQFPTGTEFRLRFTSTGDMQPHFLLAVAALGAGISYSDAEYAVQLNTIEQISGTLMGILPSRLSFTAVRRPGELKKLGGEPFRGLVIAVNGEFKDDPFVGDEDVPAFSQVVETPGDTLFAADRGKAQVLIPIGLLDWWEAPHSQYLTYIDKASSPSGNVSASKIGNGALLSVGFKYSSSTKITWRVPRSYLQKRPEIKQKSLRPLCAALYRSDKPWIKPSRSRLVRSMFYCRKRSNLRAWLLDPTKRQIAYLGARLSKGKATRTHRWRMPKGLRRGHYTLKIRAARASSSKSVAVMFVPIRKGVPYGHRSRRNGKVRHGSARANVLNGSSRNDRLYGYRGRDRLSGRRGNDLLGGGPGDDSLRGGAGLDILIGNSGQDKLRGNSGNDLLVGGSDRDKLYGGTGNDMIRAGHGDDLVRPGNGDDSVQGADGNDVIIESFGNDLLSGGEDDDAIYASRGSDHVTGEGGNDTLYGGPGRDTMAGGPGDDVIEGQHGPDVVSGGSGNDLIKGGANPDYIEGGSGKDRIFPGGDVDTVNAGSGDDYIDIADHHKEGIDCGRGDDTVRMYRYKAPLPGDYLDEDRLKSCEKVEVVPYSQGTGSDDPSEAGNIISGTKRKDVLRGTAGPDTILGRDGNDVIFGGGGKDVLEGEKGDDRIRGGTGDDIISGRNGDDWIYGGSGADRMNGDRGNDHIFGGSGNDRIRGGFGRDVIRAGSGNDRIVTVGPKKEVDRISCGRGYDVVHANRRDRVTRSCEKVIRR